MLKDGCYSIIELEKLLQLISAERVGLKQFFGWSESILIGWELFK